MSSTKPTRGAGAFFALAAGLPAAAIAVAAWDPASNGGPPLCPFRGLTGVPCPGCGLTRAAGALFRGRLGEATEIHPLILLLVVQVAAVWAFVLYAHRRSNGANVSTTAVSSPARPWAISLLSANAVVFVGVWLVRLASGSLDAAA